MSTWLISDTHFNHEKIKTYCVRPDDFTEQIIRKWRRNVKPDDLLVHLGDVFIGKTAGWDAIWPALSGRKVLVMGNHDRGRSASWWMRHGFDFACEAMVFRRCWLTHEPAGSRPFDCAINIHGHLHNFDPTHHAECRLEPWHRLLAVEYTNYEPVPFDKFVAGKVGRPPANEKENFIAASAAISSGLLLPSANPDSGHRINTGESESQGGLALRPTSLLSILNNAQITDEKSAHDTIPPSQLGGNA